MKSTGYMQMKPELIVYDQATRIVRLAKDARGCLKPPSRPEN